MILRARSWYSQSVVISPSPISGISCSPNIPSRQLKLSAPETVTKWLASGPSITTVARWNIRTENTSP